LSHSFKKEKDVGLVAFIIRSSAIYLDIFRRDHDAFAQLLSHQRPLFKNAEQFGGGGHKSKRRDASLAELEVF
jgi:hypothetical protein